MNKKTQIYLSPSIEFGEATNFKYSFENQLMKVEYQGEEEEYDFSPLPDGVLELDSVTSIFERPPILRAEKRDGVLFLTLVEYISEKSTKDIGNLEWIDADDYVFKEVDNSEDELEKPGTDE